MLEKLGIWLFSMEERKPVSYIGVFCMIVLMGTVLCLFFLSVHNYVGHQVEYLWK